MRQQSSGFRIARVNQLIKKIIAELVQQGDMYNIHSSLWITISDVDTSPDLRVADIWTHVHVLAGNVAQSSYLEKRKEIINTLNEYSGELGKKLGKQIHLKRTPKLRFKLDVTEDKAAKIDELLNDSLQH